MHDFKRLQVWHRAREFAVAIDDAVAHFPRGDHGVIGRQLRRAAMSIPTNIAEGCGKSARRETVRFLQIASGSTTEVENHLILASDLRYLSIVQSERLLDDIRSIERMLRALMQKLPP